MCLHKRKFAAASVKGETSMHFTKLHGLGNDFITIDNRNGAIAEEKKNALAARLCHRRTGIGGDGMILVENS